MGAILTLASIADAPFLDNCLGPGRCVPEPELPSIPGYQVLELLHRGGQGHVYKGVTESSKSVVAIKMPRDLQDREVQHPRFAREIAALKTLNHEHIVPILDTGEHDGRPWYSMGYVDGVPINDYCMIERLSSRKIAGLVATIARTMEYVHSVDILHRDLKPANIIVDCDGKPWLIDFGLAKCLNDRHADEQALTGEARIIGTARYMSPEQAACASQAGQSSDVYSLGIVLAELATGRTPYESESGTWDVLSAVRTLKSQDRPMRLRRRTCGLSGQKLDPQLKSIIETATRKRIVDRYNNFTDFALDLERYANGARSRPGSYCYTRKGLTRFRRRIAKPLAACTCLISIGALIAETTGFGKAMIPTLQGNDGIALQLAAMLKASNVDRNAGAIEEAAAACELAMYRSHSEPGELFKFVALGSLEKKAQLYRDQGRTAEADELTERLWVLLSQSVPSEPENEGWRVVRANAFALRSEMYASQQDWESAFRDSQMATFIHETLSEKESRKSTLNRIQARLRLANCLMNLNDVHAAYGLLLENATDLQSHEFCPAAIEVAHVALNIAAILHSYPHLGPSTDFEYWYSCAEVELKNATSDPSASFQALAIEKGITAFERIRRKTSREFTNVVKRPN